MRVEWEDHPANAGADVTEDEEYPPVQARSLPIVAMRTLLGLATRWAG